LPFPSRPATRPAATLAQFLEFATKCDPLMAATIGAIVNDAYSDRSGDE
jgi:hypothetical protein